MSYLKGLLLLLSLGHGQYIGYSQGSRNPAELMLTPYLKAGVNRIACWCSSGAIVPIWRIRIAGGKCCSQVRLKGLSTISSALVIQVKRPVLWNAEQPYLYDLYVRAGEESLAFQVGLKRDLLLMKQHNINTVRNRNWPKGIRLRRNR